MRKYPRPKIKMIKDNKDMSFKDRGSFDLIG